MPETSVDAAGDVEFAVTGDDLDQYRHRDVVERDAPAIDRLRVADVEADVGAPLDVSWLEHEMHVVGERYLDHRAGDEPGPGRKRRPVGPVAANAGSADAEHRANRHLGMARARHTAERHENAEGGRGPDGQGLVCQEGFTPRWVDFQQTEPRITPDGKSDKTAGAANISVSSALRSWTHGDDLGEVGEPERTH